MIIMSNYMPVHMSFYAAATANLHHTGMMLCVLMFIFCLIGLLPEIHSGRSWVAFSDVMTLLEVPYPTGPSVLHWLRPNFPSQRLGDLASKDLETHGNGNFSRNGGMLIYDCTHWFLFSNGWPTVTSSGHLEVQRYLMCKSVSSFVIAVARLQKLKAQEVHWFRLVFLWENAVFLPTTYLVGFTISCAYPHHQIFVMLALWWMQVPLTIVRFSGFTKSPFSFPIS